MSSIIKKNIKIDNLKIKKRQLITSTFIFTFLLYTKYFFQNWQSDNELLIEFIANSISAISFLFCILALYISTTKERVSFIFIFSFFIVNLTFFKNNYFFWCLTSYILLILYSRLDNKKSVSILFFSLLLAWFCFIPFELFFSDDIIFKDDRYLRLSLGFKNPNTLALLLFIFYTLFLCQLSLSLVKYKNLLYLTISIVIISLLYLTMSRTFFFVSVLAFLYYPFRKIDLFTPKNKFYLWFFISIIAFQLFTVFTFNNSNILSIINSILSGRIWLANIMYSNLGIPNFFIGYDIKEFLPIDFFFINILYSSGLFFFIAYIIFNLSLIKKIKHTDNMISMVICLMLLISITENIFNTLILNYSLLLLYKKGNIQK